MSEEPVKTPKECWDMVEHDLTHGQKELIFQIYSEAHNGIKENLNARTPKTIAKACTLFSMLAEEQAKAVGILIEHTDKLNKQTGILVQESKSLGRLTWALLILTAGLFLLTLWLAIGESHKETVKVITVPVTVTNVPVYIVVTNSAPVNTNLETLKH